MALFSLPAELISLVAHNLDFRDIFNLQATSIYLRDCCLKNYWPTVTKFSFPCMLKIPGKGQAKEGQILAFSLAIAEKVGLQCHSLRLDQLTVPMAMAFRHFLASRPNNFHRLETLQMDFSSQITKEFYLKFILDSETTLQRLTVQNVPKDLDILSLIFRLPKLETLNLGYDLSSELFGVQHLTPLHLLRTLRLTHGVIKIRFLNKLLALTPNLEVLEFSIGFEFHSYDIASLSQLTKLQEITIGVQGDDPHTTVPSKIVSCLSSAKKLKKVCFKGRIIAQTMQILVHSCSQLEELCLPWIAFPLDCSTGGVFHIISLIEHLQKLKSLAILDERATTAIVSVLPSLPELKFLEIACYPHQNHIPYELYKLSNNALQRLTVQISGVDWKVMPTLQPEHLKNRLCYDKCPNLKSVTFV